MNTITKFELKKIIRRKSTVIGIILLFSILMTSFFIQLSNEMYGGSYTGMSAISKRKEAFNNLSGDLTEKRLSEIIGIHNELRSKPENLPTDEYSLSGFNDSAYFKYWEKYENIDSLLVKANNPIGFTDSEIINKLTPKDINGFYLKREDKIKEFIENNNYSSKEKIMDSVRDMEDPLYYNYSDGWRALLGEIDDAFGIYILIIICICIAHLFSSEYQTQVDSIILSTKHGRDKLIRAKFNASFIFTTILYFASMAFVACLRFLTYGFDGWNCKIQTSASYWYSMYNINFLQAFLLATLLGYLASLIIMSLVMFISAKLKTPFTTVILSLGVLSATSLININIIPNLLSYVTDLLPLNMTHIVSILNNYKFYNLFGVLISQPYMMIIISIILVMILLTLTYKTFNKYTIS